MGVYDGRSNADLQARLTALLAAYDQLVSGAQIAQASYSQGDGAKSVTYRETDLVRLQMDISLLQQKLGIIHRARRRLSIGNFN
jgi:hypothetical protein